LDWLSQFGPMLVDWKKKCVQLEKDGTTVKLQVQPKQASIQLCEGVDVGKELGMGSDVLVAQIWLCEAEVVVTPLSRPPLEIQMVLDQYSLVFDPITKLPPIELLIIKYP
jgi:hypothetical protein